jgi:hypothetical protein
MSRQSAGAESNIKHCPSKKTEGVKGLLGDFSLGEREYSFSQAQRLDHGLLRQLSFGGQRLSHGGKFRLGCLATDTRGSETRSMKEPSGERARVSQGLSRHRLGPSTKPLGVGRPWPRGFRQKP